MALSKARSNQSTPRSLLLIALAMLSWNCQSSSAEYSVPCTGVSNCRVYPYRPVCADGATAVCSQLQQCLYRMVNSTSCPCMQHDVQTCDLPIAGHKGISTCTALPPGGAGGQPEATNWGGCSALP
jgi:hypothetical protein